MSKCQRNQWQRNHSFFVNKKTGYHPTDWPSILPTNRLTDTISWRDARTHLKNKINCGSTYIPSNLMETLSAPLCLHNVAWKVERSFWRRTRKYILVHMYISTSVLSIMVRNYGCAQLVDKKMSTNILDYKQWHNENTSIRFYLSKILYQRMS